MRRWWAIVVVVLGVSVLSPAASPGTAGAQEGVGGPPVLADLTVTGTGVTTYPNFGPTTRRFGIRTTGDTHGFTVTATTSSAGDVLTIGGQPATSGQGRTFRNLKPGEALTVRVANADGQRAYDLVFLPPSFPTINVTTRQAGIAPGMLFLAFFTGAPFNVVMDNNGVPVFVNRRPVATVRLQAAARRALLVPRALGAADVDRPGHLRRGHPELVDAGDPPPPQRPAAGPHRQPRGRPPARRRPDAHGLRAGRARRRGPRGHGRAGGRRRRGRRPAVEQLG